MKIYSFIETQSIALVAIILAWTTKHIDIFLWESFIVLSMFAAHMSANNNNNT